MTALMLAWMDQVIEHAVWEPVKVAADDRLPPDAKSWCGKWTEVRITLVSWGSPPRADGALSSILHTTVIRLLPKQVLRALELVQAQIEPRADP